MDFEFDLEIEFDTKNLDDPILFSLMFTVFPELFDVVDVDGFTVLDVEVEVENYSPARPAPNVKDTRSARFYDDGDNMEADVKLFADINNVRTELPDALVKAFDLLDDVDRIGREIIAENAVDFQLRKYEYMQEQ